MLDLRSIYALRWTLLDPVTQDSSAIEYPLDFDFESYQASYVSHSIGLLTWIPK